MNILLPPIKSYPSYASDRRQDRDGVWCRSQSKFVHNTIAPITKALYCTLHMYVMYTQKAPHGGNIQYASRKSFRSVLLPCRSFHIHYAFLVTVLFTVPCVRNAFCYFSFKFQLKRSSTAAEVFLFAPIDISVQRQSGAFVRSSYDCRVVDGGRRVRLVGVATFPFGTPCFLRLQTVFASVLMPFSGPFCYRSDHRFLDNANRTKPFP